MEEGRFTGSRHHMGEILFDLDRFQCATKIALLILAKQSKALKAKQSKAKTKIIECFATPLLALTFPHPCLIISSYRRKVSQPFF